MSLPPLPPTTIAAAAVEPAPDAPPSPTTTHYETLARDFMTQLDAIAAIIPKLEGAHTLTVNFVRGHQNVPMEFLNTVISAVEQMAELQNINKLDPVAARDAMQFIAAFRPVVDRLETFMADLVFTVRSKKAAVASNALQVYDVAQGLARDAGSSSMLSRVQQMKRDLKRGKPKKKIDDSIKAAQPPQAAAA